MPDNAKAVSAETNSIKVDREITMFIKEQLKQLIAIESKAKEIANKIDVNCEDSQKLYQELSHLANELGCVINALEASQK